jgi:hypothetical protein
MLSGKPVLYMCLSCDSGQVNAQAYGIVSDMPVSKIGGLNSFLLRLFRFFTRTWVGILRCYAEIIPNFHRPYKNKNKINNTYIISSPWGN